ncbi:MAG TPA: hypothetical protein VLA34_04885, partial [Candidatus Krumholzibacterium sp.]|nr:hypothetical protein [Candidatus Krumholzibacterium sp.]
MSVFRHRDVSFMIITAAALCCAASCGGGKGAGPFLEIPRDPGMPEDCVLTYTSGRQADTVSVALLDRVEPARAPLAANLSEEVVFGHLYETLIDIDCSGAVRAALAASWKKKDGGRRWVFTIRRGARFSGGSSVRAADIIEGWSLSGGYADSDYGIDSVYASGDAELAVVFDRKHEEVPASLASMRFAAVRRSRRYGWPEGTGRYRVIAGPGEGRDAMVLDPVKSRKDPVISCAYFMARQARDVIDRGMDILLTDDPAAVEYGNRHERYVDIPLPWKTVHVLLSPSRVNAIRWERDTEPLGGDFLGRLAGDAVREEARAARGPYWWEDLSACPDGAGTQGMVPVILRGADPEAAGRYIVCAADDRIARQLAERLVALASSVSGSSSDAASLVKAMPGLERGARPVAQSLDPAAMAPRLRYGEDFAYIIGLPLVPVDPCCRAARLHRRAPWLNGLGDRAPESILPLVETRPHLVVREGRVTVSVDILGRIMIGLPRERTS